MAEEEQQRRQEGAPAPQAKVFSPVSGEKWGIIPRFLWEHRLAWWMWLALALLAVAAGVGGFFLLKWLACLTGAELKTWMQSTGPWTAMIVLAGLPLGLFFWIIRDRSKAVEHEQEQERIAQTAAEHAWTHFRQLQEWVTSENATLQTAALHQLRPFIMGESGGVIPKELLEPKNHFISSAMAVLRALLDDRSWLEKWKKEIAKVYQGSDAPRSPVIGAIETLLRAKGLPWKDFAGWNLSSLHLAGASLRRAELQKADLHGAELQDADLWGAQLHEAKMHHVELGGANLQRANLVLAELQDGKLQSAELRGAFLLAVNLQDAVLYRSKMQGVNLQFANLQGADLQLAELQGADLWRAVFEGADLTGAKIEEKWRDVIDWKSFKLKGMPTFVENESDELPEAPPLGDASMIGLVAAREVRAPKAENKSEEEPTE